MAMDLPTFIVRKQAEAATLANQVFETQRQLDATNEVIARVQDLAYQPSYTHEEIDYLLSVDAL